MIDLLKSEVDPDVWETVAGTEVRAQGEHLLVARAPAGTLDGIALALHRYETVALRAMTVEVAAVRAPAKDLAALTDGAVVPEPVAAAWLESGDAGPHVALPLLAEQRATAFRGLQRSLLTDVDVEVAEDASAQDPIVSVQNLGLGIGAHAVPTFDGRSAWLSISADLALPVDERAAPSPRGTRVVPGRPAIDVTHARADLVVPLGAWVLLGGRAADAGPGWCFLVRVHDRPFGGRVGPGATGALPTLGESLGQRIVFETLDVRALNQSPLSRVGRELHLVPSNFAPPEPPELPEPTPVFPAEALVDLIRALSPPGTWDRRGVSIDARNGHLYVRQASGVLEGMRALRERLRERLLWVLEVEVEVVEVDAARVPGALAGEEVAGSGAEAVRLDGITWSSMNGMRTAVLAGRVRRYLQDYEVEIAQKASIANPVMRDFLEGVQVDLTGRLCSGRDVATLEVRFQRALGRDVRVLETEHGPLELPEVGLYQFRTTITAPLGATSVAGVAGDGARRTLVLVTPRMRSAP
jgi:hypothetical protein